LVDGGLRIQTIGLPLMEPTLVRLLLIIAAERLALGAIDQLPLSRRLARTWDDDSRLRSIAERIPDEGTWKAIEVEILAPDFPLPEDADRGAFLGEVLHVVSRVLTDRSGS
jgi:hypothetical protein